MTYRGRVGLGITTMQREQLFRRCRESVVTHLKSLVDVTVCYVDGGPDYVGDNPPEWQTFYHADNRGWSVAKNTCLAYLLSRGCDHIFMIEDDTTVTDSRAVTGYIDAALESGLHYMTAHPWGEATTTKVEEDGPVTFWAYCGSWWTYMSGVGLRRGGDYNPVLGGIMGDIELPQRWALQGLTSGWGRLPDATSSEQWVKPDCLTVDQSLIANRPGWKERQEYLLRWWAETMPQTLPCEMKPAREGNWARKCDDTVFAQSAAAVQSSFI